MQRKYKYPIMLLCPECKNGKIFDLFIQTFSFNYDDRKLILTLEDEEGNADIKICSKCGKIANVKIETTLIYDQTIIKEMEK